LSSSAYVNEGSRGSILRCCAARDINFE
jgi:hypothetical protein